MTPWLSIVGIGEDGIEALSPAARALIDGAEILVGGERHLAMLPPDDRPRHVWPRPLAALVTRIAGWRGRRVCVLASGDPMWFGIGVTLARRIRAEEMTIIPSPSAFALACARMGWPAAEVRMLTLHGRPIELLLPHLQPGARLLLLAADGTTAAAVATLLTRQGWGPSVVTVLEHMGGPRERRLSAEARGWSWQKSADLATIAVECRPAEGTPIYATVPGLPDEAFDHDGQLTKREVRAVTLSALLPIPGQTLWDIGSGSGSIAIEWMRCDPRNRAVAIERDVRRVARIGENAAALGVPGLHILHGAAPSALAPDLPRPDAVFIGGGIGQTGMIEHCLAALPPGGRLVANVVTVEGEAAVAAAQARHGGDLIRLAVQRAEPVGPFLGWRPLMQVTQWVCRR